MAEKAIAVRLVDSLQAMKVDNLKVNIFRLLDQLAIKSLAVDKEHGFGIYVLSDGSCLHWDGNNLSAYDGLDHLNISKESYFP